MFPGIDPRVPQRTKQTADSTAGKTLAARWPSVADAVPARSQRVRDVPCFPWEQSAQGISLHYYLRRYLFKDFLRVPALRVSLSRLWSYNERNSPLIGMLD